MILDEAYDKMVRGYLVHHESFGKGEYLWMNSQGIIYDENGNEFADNQFSRDDDMWQKGWSIYKAKATVKVKRRDRMITDENDTTFYDTRHGERCPQLDGDTYEMYNQLGLDTMANPGNIGLVDKTSEDINTRVSSIAEKHGNRADNYDVVSYENEAMNSNNYNGGIRIPDGYNEIKNDKNKNLKLLLFAIASWVLLFLFIALLLIFK